MSGISLQDEGGSERPPGVLIDGAVGWTLRLSVKTWRYHTHEHTADGWMSLLIAEPRPSRRADIIFLCTKYVRRDVKYNMNITY